MATTSREAAEMLIPADKDSIRFERFCAELYSAGHGVTVVPTSRNYDLGRDGISLARPLHVLCGTQRKDLHDKIDEDLARVVQTTKPEVLIYCVNQPLTEHARDKIAAVIRAGLPSVGDVVVMGLEHILGLVERFDGLFVSHYKVELQNLQLALAAARAVLDPRSEQGLRLALCAQASASGQELRNGVLAQLVLTALSDGRPDDINGVAGKVSRTLQLARPIRPHTLEEVLAVLCKRDSVIEIGGRFRITANGLAELTPRSEPEKLPAGREILERAVEAGTGNRLSRDDANDVWSKFRDGLGEILFDNGMRIVTAVAELLGEDPAPPELGRTTPLAIEIGELAKRCTRSLTPADRASEVALSISDAFTTKGEGAFDWLADVAVAYLAMASIGLEAHSNEAIRTALRRFILVIDTDQALSYLCEGETNHAEVKSSFDEWRRIGGRIAVATAVLEELAYHAWVAELDFDHTHYLRGKPHASAYIENAFVRAYWKLADQQKSFSKTSFLEYIRNFRGDSKYDLRPIEEVLFDECKFEHLQEEPNDEPLAHRIGEFLVGIGNDDRTAYFRDKCDRDGRLLASVAGWRRELTAERKPETVCLVSSSGLLSVADRKFRQDLGTPECVIPTAAIAFLLSMLPGSQLGLAAIRALLLDTKAYRLKGPIQRVGMRLLAQTKEFALPLSKRVTLERRLFTELHRESRERGVTDQVQEESFARLEDIDSAARAIAAAVDSIGAGSMTEQEKLRLLTEVRELKDAKDRLTAEVDRLKRQDRKRSRR